tara:strand:- start:13 stop:1029 length:1017 start_codon:yes stop_codon:yes gene_type:complete
VASYIVRRVLIAVFTLFVISFLTFIIAQLPEGDAVTAYLQRMHERGGMAPGRSYESMAVLREYWGLDRPLIVQYWDWIWGIISTGEFGYSWSNNKSVARVINERLPFTIFLALFTTILVWVWAIPVGIYSAIRKNSIGDYVFTFAGFMGLAIPDFLLGLVLMYVLFAYFDMSVGGLFSGEYLTAPWSIARALDLIQHLIIPGIVIGTAGTAGLIRIMRNNLLDELQKPYVITARAKGMASWKVVVKYPLRLAINPLISGIGGMLPGLLSGDAIVSVVLSLPTLGPTLLDALLNEDMELVGTSILMYASLGVIGVLISDLMLVVVDPRIKLTGSGRGNT